MASRKLSPCPMTVANAAPKAPIFKPAMNQRSSARLTTAARAMKRKGRLESPMPRRIALTVLYP